MQPSLRATGDPIPVERFSAELWSGSEDTYRAILEHPFITGLNEHAAGAIAVERSLHAGFFADFGLSEQDVASTPIAPTNLAYTSYLVAARLWGLVR